MNREKILIPILKKKKHKDNVQRKHTRHKLEIYGYSEGKIGGLIRCVERSNSELEEAEGRVSGKEEKLHKIFNKKFPSIFRKKGALHKTLSWTPLYYQTRLA